MLLRYRRQAWLTTVLLLALVGLSGCDLLTVVLPTVVDDESQGLFGVVMFLPGVCLEDPEHPGECLNKPFPGRAAFDIRQRTDAPDQGLNDPILKSFESGDDGLFRVGLVPGSYCVWQGNGCTPVDVLMGEWVEVPLVVALP